jgi:tetratricopeptide (TPR) repeat protein
VPLGIRLIAFVTLSACALGAQTFGVHAISVRAEIVSTSMPMGALTVELAPQSGGSPDRIPVNPDGSFQIHVLSPGTYELRVYSLGARLIHQQIIAINATTPTVTVHLPEASTAGSANRAAGNSVSLNQLRHKVPAQAQKLFEKGEQSLARHNLAQASTYFQEAVARDPEFVDAYAQLGGAEAALGRLPEAAAQLQKAVDLAPEHEVALPNLSIVLAKMRRLQEAGVVARRALKVAPSSGRLHYILAASIIEEKGNTDEAIDHLERAGDDIPSAHLAASDLLLDRGRPDEALRQVEAFLLVAAPDDPLRAKAEARLSLLQKR